jgi:hypothetical protein
MINEGVNLDLSDVQSLPMANKSKYTAYHRRSYEKHKETHIKRVMDYYTKHKAEISIQRKEKYRAKKAAAALLAHSNQSV